MKLCDRKDAAIIADEREETKGDKMLYDCDGYLLFVFPLAEGWEDEQMILRALDFANEAFERGVRVGRSDKAFEIRKALGMTQ